jgi:hypothetical protein
MTTLNDSRYTPGPWKVVQVGSNIYIQDGDGHDIALVYRPYPGDNESGAPADLEARRAANARLIAAAPQLLEIVNELLVEIVAHEEREGQFYDLLMDKMRAARMGCEKGKQ